MAVESVKASQARDEFMMLLITQLKNQDPLDPVKQENFLSQLAQFSSLEQMEKTNALLEDQAASQQQAAQLQQLSQAATFVGRTISYQVTTEGAAPQTLEGVVDSVSIQSGQLKFKVGDQTVTWAQITEISADAKTPSSPVPGGSTSSTGSTGQETETTNAEEEPVLRRRGAGG